MKKLAVALALSTALSGCVSLGKEPPPIAVHSYIDDGSRAGRALGQRQGDRGAGGDRARRTAQARRHPRAGAGRCLERRLSEGCGVGRKAYSRCSPACSAETIRAKQTRMVVEGSDVRFAAATKLSGQLLRNDLRCGDQLGGRPLRRGAAAARWADPPRRFEATVRCAGGTGLRRPGAERGGEQGRGGCGGADRDNAGVENPALCR